MVLSIHTSAAQFTPMAITPTTVQNPVNPPSQTNPIPQESPTPTKVSVEIPSSSGLPINPFDPTWVKLLEQVGPISYLAMLCLFIWLLIRLVETVKGKA